MSRRRLVFTHKLKDFSNISKKLDSYHFMITLHQIISVKIGFICGQFVSEVIYQLLPIIIWRTCIGFKYVYMNGKKVTRLDHTLTIPNKLVKD